MTEGAGVEARSMLDRLVARPAWAAIRLRDSATVTLVGGRRSTVERLADVPLEEGAPEAAAGSTGCSRSRSGRSPSAGSRRTTTAPR